jgi:hypothetical protein
MTAALSVITGPSGSTSAGTWLIGFSARSLSRAGSEVSRSPPGS